jgi:hypothetical protein
MADSKRAAVTTVPVAPGSLVVEVMAGTEATGHTDGDLSVARFTSPCALCRYGDLLFVVDHLSSTIRVLEGVLGVADPLANCKVTAQSLRRVQCL